MARKTDVEFYTEEIKSVDNLINILSGGGSLNADSIDDDLVALERERAIYIKLRADAQKRADRSFVQRLSRFQKWIYFGLVKIVIKIIQLRKRFKK